jgi:hypothetical protein
MCAMTDNTGFPLNKNECTFFSLSRLFLHWHSPGVMMEPSKLAEINKNNNYSYHQLVFRHLHQSFGAQIYVDQTSANQNYS